MASCRISESQWKDDELIASGLRGNEEAFDELFSRHRQLLYSLAQRILRNHEEAEDAVQNCLFSAFRNLQRFGCQGAFRSWLVRILINEALTILRKKKARPVIVSESAAPEEQENWLERFPSLIPGPEQIFARRQLAARLRKHLVRLSASMRSAALLCDIGEYTAQEAGTILGVKTHTVKARLFRARRTLQRNMGVELPLAPP